MEEPPKQPSQDFHHLQRLGVVTGITLSNILVFGGIGYWLDKTYGTKPWILIAGLILAFPLSQFEIYKVMKEIMTRKSTKND